MPYYVIALSLIALLTGALGVGYATDTEQLRLMALLCALAMTTICIMVGFIIGRASEREANDEHR